MTVHNTVQALEGTGHWTDLKGQKIFMWRKQPAGGKARRALIFVHGSSMASQCCFDLQVPGRPEASAMNWFAAAGYDTWCFDCRGYGHSFKPDDFSATVSDGADDMEVVIDYVRKVRGAEAVDMYGASSGALRAALFAQRHPELVHRVVLDAMVWTGKGSPTLDKRRERLAEWRATNRRPINPTFLRTIFTRDHAGTTVEEFIEPFIAQALEADDTVPNGTYIDMCANLPLVDPEKIKVPTQIIRGQYDGIASIEDILSFFGKLATPHREFATIPGAAHATTLSKNFLMVFDVIRSFLDRRDLVLSR